MGSSSSIGVAAAATFALLVAPAAVAQSAAAPRVPPQAVRLDARSLRDSLQPPAGQECEATARVVLAAAQHEAMADFWRTIGTSLNEPADAWADLLKGAFAVYEEALARAEEQYQARLEVCAEFGSAPYDPQLDPADFDADVDNGYFPLVPNTSYVYERRGNGDVERVETTVQQPTIEVNGIEVRAVHEVGSLNGEVFEVTTDWYAQDLNDNVWYLGELAQNFEDGFLANLDGSWRYGKVGASPGIVMLGAPQIGDLYRQEFLVDVAEDVAKVIALDVTVTVPAGTFAHCLHTEEWSALDPGVHEWRYFAPGVGMVLEFEVETGERLELVRMGK